MAQYCSLQEAFNLPTVPRKKKPYSAKNLEEPYDPYTEQTGKEQVLYEPFQSGEDTVVKESQERKLGAKASATGRGMGGDSGYEGARKTYASQYSDYDYICKTAGICLDEKKPEKFQNYETVPSSSPATKRPNPASCSPLSPPPYEYPLTDADKARFRKALKVALEEMESSSPGPAPRQNFVPKAFETRKVDMTTVDGYIDEELESYMMIHDMKPVIPDKEERVPKSILPEDLPGLESKSSAVASPFVEDVKANPSYKIPDNFTKKNKIWFDLLLFVGSGILIIFLLEQLFKLALITGMKKTVEALEVLIQERIAAPQ